MHPQYPSQLNPLLVTIGHEITIAVDLLEKFTSKIVITPDSEEGGVITPDFATPVKGLK